MEVNFNKNIESFGRIEGTKPQKVEAQTLKNAAPSFAQSEVLEQTLHQTPDIRADVVARAKELVKAPSYPANETLKQIASLLAKNISKDF